MLRDLLLSGNALFANVCLLPFSNLFVMILSEKYKAYLIGLVSLLVVVLLLLWIGEIILPFIFAIFIAYLLNPLILKIQNKVRNKNLAITSFLFIVTILFAGIVFFFGKHIVQDSKRLVNGVEVFAEEHEKEIMDIKGSLLGFVDEVYESDAFKNQIDNIDTLAANAKEMDLMSTIGSVYSFFGDSDMDKEEVSGREPWSPFYMLLYTLLYTVFVMYTYQYFEDKYIKYFGNRNLTNERLEGIWSDFKKVFIIYFSQRAKVILINMAILILAFTLLDLPGAIIIAILTGILSYASHFHYLSLPLVGIGCWVLSIENGNSFFIYFGFVLGVFILISILDETVYFDKIMNSVNGMNPAIMMLAFTLWIYVFGGFIGTIIALPLTQLIMVFMDRLMMYSRENGVMPGNPNY